MRMRNKLYFTDYKTPRNKKRKIFAVKMADRHHPLKRVRQTDSEKKRRKSARNRQYYESVRRTSVIIANQFTRWQDFKTMHQVTDDEEAAKMLLDHHECWVKEQKLKRDASELSSAIIKGMSTAKHRRLAATKRDASETGSQLPSSAIIEGMSTPKHRRLAVTKRMNVSASTPAKSATESPHFSDVSSIHRLESSKSSETEGGSSSQTERSPVVHADQHDITLDQIEMDVTVEPSIEEELGGLTYIDDEEDSDYVPDFVQVNYRNVGIDYENLETVGEDDEDSHSERQQEIVEEMDDIDPDYHTDTQLLHADKCISFDHQLLLLARLSIPKLCPKCHCNINRKVQHIGSCTLIVWTCLAGHRVERWCSQPIVKKYRLGDFLLATNILLSGNNYQKISTMFKFMNLGCVSHSTFYRLQKHVCLPAIYEFWDKEVQQVLDDLRGQELVLMGDGQNDSPGHCAQYLNYNMMEQSTGKLVHVNTIDKRATDGNSTKMEIVGYKKALESLEQDGQIIKEVVTDAHIQIKSYMAKEKGYIKHSNDIWHGAKGVAKNISKAALKAENKSLGFWAKDIVNHFWWCAKNCQSDVNIFKAYWRGVLHHVVNKHEWLSGDGCIIPKCKHEPLSPNYNITKWLQPGSKPHITLESIVLNTRLLRNIPYFTNFRHTGDIESFHSFKLMYNSKRHFYSYPAYHGRCLLAAIDFNAHKGREVLRNEKGEIRYKKKFCKRSGTWTATAQYSPKEYTYIPDLINLVFEKLKAHKSTLHSKVELAQDDPRRIRPSSAKTDAPSLEVLVQRHKSRF